MDYIIFFLVQHWEQPMPAKHPITFWRNPISQNVIKNPSFWKFHLSRRKTRVGIFQHTLWKTHNRFSSSNTTPAPIYCVAAPTLFTKELFNMFDTLGGKICRDSNKNRERPFSAGVTAHLFRSVEKLEPLQTNNAPNPAKLLRFLSFLPVYTFFPLFL